MNRDDAIQEIKSRTEFILQALYPKAVNPANHKASYVCPLCGHGSHGDGLTINPKSRSRGLKCFSCEFSGDIIELVQQDENLSFGETVDKLAGVLGVVIDSAERPQKPLFNGNSNLNGKNIAGTAKPAKGPNYGQIVADAVNSEQTVDYTEYYRICGERLNDPAAKNYLVNRGIDIDKARACGIGYDPEADPANAPGAIANVPKRHPAPRIIIPTSKDHYIGRRIDGQKEYAKLNPKGGTPGLFNESALFAQDVKEVFVTEGAIDALSVMRFDNVAVALNSTSNTGKLIDAVKNNRPAATLVLMLDNDDAGKRATETLANGLKALDLPFVTANLKDYKDPNEALVADFEGFCSILEDAEHEAEAERQRIAREEAERRERTGAEMVDSFLSAVQSRRYEPVPTGVKDIDDAIGGGLIRQQLILLGAAPGAGKTALAQWIFEKMAGKGHPCIFLNLEMSREQMIARSLTRLASYNGIRLRVTDVLKGYQWTDEQREAVEDAAALYKQTIAPYIIYNPDGITPNLDDILEYMDKEATRAKNAGNPVPFICIDYLQILTSGDPREDEFTLIKRAVGRFKTFAIENNTVVFLIQAHNRSVNSRGEPTMSAGRGSSSIEYTADLQLSLNYTACLKRGGGKAEEDLTEEEKKFVTLTVTKGRFSKPGAQADLVFDGETMQYRQREIIDDGEPWEQGDFSDRFQNGQRKAGHKL